MTHLTDEQIIAIRDEHLHKRGELITLAYARAIEAAVLAANPGVPREPTPAMEQAGLDYCDGKTGARGIWRAMYDAAPPPPPLQESPYSAPQMVGAAPEQPREPEPESWPLAPDNPWGRTQEPSSAAADPSPSCPPCYGMTNECGDNGCIDKKEPRADVADVLARLKQLGQQWSNASYDCGSKDAQGYQSDKPAQRMDGWRDKFLSTVDAAAALIREQDAELRLRMGQWLDQVQRAERAEAERDEAMKQSELRHRLLCLHHADAMELWAALKDLSFECDGVIGRCNAPSVETYNRTFSVLKRHEQGYSEAVRSNPAGQFDAALSAERERGEK